MKFPSRRVSVAFLAPLLVLSGRSSPDVSQKSARQVVADLSAKISTARPSQVTTAQNDPNKLLRRPGQYTSAAVFSDSRVPKENQNPNQLSADNGDKIEVFATEVEAKSRPDYIQSLAKQTPLAAEYDYLAGTVLVRVSKNLNPDVAKQYQHALEGS